MAKKRSKKPPVSRAKTTRWAWLPVLGIGALALYCYWNAQSNELPVIAGPDYPKREAIATHRQLSHYTVYHRLNRQRIPGVSSDARASQTPNGTAPGTARLLPPEEVPQWSSQWSAGQEADTSHRADPTSVETLAKDKAKEKGMAKDPGGAKRQTEQTKVTQTSQAGDAKAVSRHLADSGTGKKNGVQTRDKNTSHSTGQSVHDKKAQTKKAFVSALTKALSRKDDRSPKLPKANNGPVTHVIGVFPTKEKAMAIYRAWQASATRHRSPLRPLIQKGTHQGRTLYRVVMTGSVSPSSSVSSWMRRLKPA